jgi:F0F1-type ATP synthase membrane subunit c/vacuolar-type H+-ATPase subunit K
MLWDAANQLSREKDQSIIMATFSNTVSLVALIIALVALFKGVG